jgi:hypothetical protein
MNTATLWVARTGGSPYIPYLDLEGPRTDADSVDSEPEPEQEPELTAA